MAFKEALRLMPPVPSIPRRALREFEFEGFRQQPYSPSFGPVRYSPQNTLKHRHN
jgi:hypothetical protein